MSVTVPKRKPKRIRVLLDGHLCSPESSVEVRIRDVSEMGALVELAGEANVDGSFKLAFLDTQIGGELVWREGSWAGVEFDEPLKAAVWEEVSKKQLRVGAPRKYRHDQLQPDEARLEVIPRNIVMRSLSR
ncbi:MAG: PilZ domain-containing protein [Pseudomonadota bacterium]